MTTPATEHATQSSTLALRATSVVFLLFGFYVLAFGLAAACLAVPWEEHAYLGHISWAGYACGAAGFWFLFAVFPGWPAKGVDRAAPLAPDAHPRLRRMIQEVAERVGQAPPEIVYLLPDANAFAAREGGFLGFGGKRVVGLGLPLLSTLSEDEIRSVLAHEFGHHQAGDLRLGPFVHRTRMAVGRAIARLDGSSFLLHWPFLLYAQLFLRVSRSISREQELAADALAAKVVGRAATARALSRIETLAPRWDAYFGGEVLPLLAGGKRPPLLAGFRLFLSHAPWRADVATLVRRAEHRAPREHDTHPSLEDRLAALGVLSRDLANVKETDALSLLDAPEQAEADAVSLVVKRDARLTNVGWDAIADEGWLPLWRSSLVLHKEALANVPVRGFPAALKDPEMLWLRLHPSSLSLLSPLGLKRSVAATLGVYLSVVAKDAGFSIAVPPGAEIVATKGELRFEPEVLVRQLAEGLLMDDEFLEEVSRLGIADIAGFVDASAPTATEQRVQPSWPNT